MGCSIEKLVLVQSLAHIQIKLRRNPMKTLQMAVNQVPRVSNFHSSNSRHSCACDMPPAFGCNHFRRRLFNIFWWLYASLNLAPHTFVRAWACICAIGVRCSCCVFMRLTPCVMRSIPICNSYVCTLRVHIRMCALVYASICERALKCIGKCWSLCASVVEMKLFWRYFCYSLCVRDKCIFITTSGTEKKCFIYRISEAKLERNIRVYSVMWGEPQWAQQKTKLN